MTRVATAISIWAKTGVAVLTLGVTAPALAQDDDQDDDQVVYKANPDAGDVVRTPMTDLNIDPKDIPEILLSAVDDPYNDDGLKGCKQIAAAIGDLDTVLGNDFDLGVEERGRISAGRIATSVVGSFIPFRSIIREITGAADHKRDLQEAIMAGAVRRGYLKGLGQQRGCAYPARPAEVRVIVERSDQKADPEQANGSSGVTFVSKPVVQGEDD